MLAGSAEGEDGEVGLAGFVRVMRPRTIVPVSGTRGPAARAMETVGWGADFDFEACEVRVPAREE